MYTKGMSAVMGMVGATGGWPRNCAIDFGCGASCGMWRPAAGPSTVVSERQNAERTFMATDPVSALALHNIAARLLLPVIDTIQLLAVAVCVAYMGIFRPFNVKPAVVAVGVKK